MKRFKNTKEKFGNCGKIMYVDSKPRGYAQYAPPAFLEASRNYDSPPSDDAVLISCLFIPQKEFRRLGLGLRLLKPLQEKASKKTLLDL